MRVDAFDFDLPASSIALHPARPRDAARLLVVKPDEALEGRVVRDLPDLLRPGDVIVVNDTRVIPARLDGTRRRGETSAVITVTLHKREAPDRWRVFLKPAKRIALGESIVFAKGGETLEAVVMDKREGGEAVLAFAASGRDLDRAIDRIGQMPLPPYIAARRGPDRGDDADYQTMFAREPGAVAAPTAGLHFTPELLAALTRRGVGVERVTLHVGAGTFLPMKVEDTADHRMHAEWGTVDGRAAARLNAARAAGGRIVAIGTTVLRILETAAATDGTIAPFAGETAIFIVPGYRFRGVDLLMTNFHLPRSTLVMLVAAFSGLAAIKAAYAHAVDAGYRFYSYGDACLLHPTGASG